MVLRARPIICNRLILTHTDNDYQNIAKIVDDADSWQQWIGHFRDLHQLWIDRGFIAMFQPLLHRLKVAQTLALSENAERRLTNLLHLGEVLQQQSRLCAGIDSLLAWYQNSAYYNWVLL